MFLKLKEKRKLHAGNEQGWRRSWGTMSEFISDLTAAPGQLSGS